MTPGQRRKSLLQLRQRQRPIGGAEDGPRRNLQRTSGYSFAAHDFACVDLSPRKSMASFGTMRPKLIARTMIMAVMPSAIVALISSTVVCAPPAICTRPLAILNSRTPGIIDTTEAKP